MSMFSNLLGKDGPMATIMETDVSDESGISETDAGKTSKETSEDSNVMSTEVLLAMAEKEMEEMKPLLSKVKTGTATRKEKDRLLSLNKKLSEVKKEIEVTKSREDAKEIEDLRSVTNTKATTIRKALRKKEISSVVRAVGEAEKVDLAFIIDCTSSMSPYIEGVKENIKNIVRQVRKTNGGLNLRLAVVGYRDIDDSPRYEVQDFSPSIDEFEEFLGNLRASGGADAPEDMAGGIKSANVLSWDHPTRVAFLIADAPCHGEDFHTYGSGGDSYPGGTPGISIVNELRELVLKHSIDGTMTLHFGRITSETDKMISEFGRRDIHLQVVDINETTKLARAVTSGVRRSIFKTITATGGDKRTVSFSPVDTFLGSGKESISAGTKKSLKSFSIRPSFPTADEWELRPAVKVNVYRNRPIRSIADLQAPLGFGVLDFRESTDKTKKSQMFMRRAQNPFAEGEVRIAYHGLLSRDLGDLNADKNSVVMKSFKHIGEGVHDRKQYLKQMEVSNIAEFLAARYNISENRNEHCAPIHFLPVCVVEADKKTSEKTGETRFCVEELLPKDGSPFTKYSNNTGHWDDEFIDESLLRFTAYTYSVTGGYLMVTDLQGVRKDGSFILTDPVILCEDEERFGYTNLGPVFMAKCMNSTHAHLDERSWEAAS